MALKKLVTPTSEGGDFEIPPAGVYLARCYRMVDLGTQDTEYQGVSKKQRQIHITWELLKDDDDEEVRMSDGRPFVISQTYTWSLGKRSNLLKALNSWRGRPFTDEEVKEFDISNLLGKFVKLQVVHKTSTNTGNTYANIEGLMSTKKTAEGVNEITSFSIQDFDLEEYSNLPKWLQEKISKAEEYGKSEETPKVKSDKSEEESDLDLGDLPF